MKNKDAPDDANNKPEGLASCDLALAEFPNGDCTSTSSANLQR